MIWVTTARCDPCVAIWYWTQTASQCVKIFIGSIAFVPIQGQHIGDLMYKSVDLTKILTGCTTQKCPVQKCPVLNM